MKRVINKTLLNEATTSQFSEPISVRYAKKATLQFERTDHVSGSAVFKIAASLDGQADGGDFVPAVNMISNDVNNHSQTLERNITVELTGNGKVITALDLEHFCYDYIMVKLTEGGSGKSTVKILIVE